MRGADVRTERAIAVSLVLTAAFSGCFKGPAPPESSAPVAGDSCARYTAPLLFESDEFEGMNAFGHMLRIACDFSTSPPHERYRVPGSPGREQAARYIAGELRAERWSVRWENFTGTQYQALPHGGVSDYASNCPVDQTSRVANLTFSNVVAEVGTSGPLYLFMAHYDSKRFANQDPDPANRTRPVLGANDGASGVGVLLEAARLLPREPPNATLRILLDDGEDGFEDCHPLAGAIYHAQHLSGADRDRFGGLLLLDMVGDADARFCLTSNDAALRSRVVEAARSVGADAVERAINCGISDDHIPFVDLDLPAADLVDYQPGVNFTPYWHTSADTPDKLSPIMLEDVGRVVVELGNAWARH